MRRSLGAFRVSCALIAGSAPLFAQSAVNCQPGWRATFGLQGGVDGDVAALTVFDDGTGGGPALYAAGNFANAGGVPANNIAKWDGDHWSALASGLTHGQFTTGVYALCVFDDGSGPALYAGGTFADSGAAVVNDVAKWDGSTWSPLGSGMSGAPSHIVRALAVFDDGSGPALFAAGVFTSAGGTVVSHIAKWDGAHWSALGRGLTQGQFTLGANALCVFDDGGGPALYVGGGFANAGGTAAKHVAKWNGSTWSSLGAGLPGHNVQCLAAFDDGTGGGPALYAGGWFNSSGLNQIAKWDGSTWTALGAGLTGGLQTSALAVFDDSSGGGPVLFAGGDFTTAGSVSAQGIAKWNGSSWSALANGAGSWVGALTVYDDSQGGGPSLFAGGTFTNVPDSGDSYIAKWGLPPGCGSTGTPACDPAVGGVIACPCANPSAGPGRGCDNSASTGGASITATGIPSLAADSLVFTALDEKPTATSIVLSGTASVAAGHVYGQGVRCVGGALRRLYVRSASGGTVVVPAPSDPSVSSRHASLSDPIAPGTHRYYMFYYRDPTVLGGCSASSTFNGTNMLDVSWVP